MFRSFSWTKNVSPALLVFVLGCLFFSAVPGGYLRYRQLWCKTLVLYCQQKHWEEHISSVLGLTVFTYTVVLSSKFSTATIWLRKYGSSDFCNHCRTKYGFLLSSAAKSSVCYSTKASKFATDTTETLAINSAPLLTVLSFLSTLLKCFLLLFHSQNYQDSNEKLFDLSVFSESSLFSFFILLWKYFWPVTSKRYLPISYLYLWYLSTLKCSFRVYILQDAHDLTMLLIGRHELLMNRKCFEMIIFAHY